METSPVNHRPSTLGRVKAVCEFCDRDSEPVQPDGMGEPDLWALPRGWSICPFPPDFVHRDGSRGSTFTCATCRAKLMRGERLMPHPTRIAARAAS